MSLDDSPWVRAWLCQPVISGFKELPDSLVPTIKDFVESQDASPTMRARGLLALAVHQAVSTEYVSNFARSFGGAEGGDVAAAAGFVMNPDSAPLKSIKARGYLNHIVADRAGADASDRSWL